MTDQDTATEDAQEQAFRTSRRLSVALRIFECLIAYYARTNAALIAQGHGDRIVHLSNLELTGQSIELADDLISGLDGVAQDDGIRGPDKPVVRIEV